jgi:catechol 2,3-dioxygenase-like lactoylglutathione lyase family enzyme
VSQIDPDKPVQIAIVVRDLEAKIRVWSEFLGVEPSKVLTTGTLEETRTRYRGAATPARVRVAVFEVGHCEIELLQPIDAPSAWSDHLEKYGEGLHHLGFLVADMDAGDASVVARGMPVVQDAEYENDFERGRYAYFESQSQLGALLEFNEVS